MIGFKCVQAPNQVLSSIWLVAMNVVPKMLTLELMELKDKDRFNDCNLQNSVESI